MSFLPFTPLLPHPVIISLGVREYLRISCQVSTVVLSVVQHLPNQIQVRALLLSWSPEHRLRLAAADVLRIMWQQSHVTEEVLVTSTDIDPWFLQGTPLPVSNIFRFGPGTEAANDDDHRTRECPVTRQWHQPQSQTPQRVSNVASKLVSP